MSLHVKDNIFTSMVEEHRFLLCASLHLPCLIKDFKCQIITLLTIYFLFQCCFGTRRLWG